MFGKFLKSIFLNLDDDYGLLGRNYGKMTTKVLMDSGNGIALLGLGLSYGSTAELVESADTDTVLQELNAEPVMGKLIGRAKLLANKGKGHNKFLESIVVWIYTKAPRYWWQEFDTYRIGVTKQSESTMHTIMRGFLTSRDFMPGTDPEIIRLLNEGIKRKDFRYVKVNLPESFLQGRIICTNYKALLGIYEQRKNHRLPEWQQFFVDLESGLLNPEYVFGETSNNQESENE